MKNENKKLITKISNKITVEIFVCFVKVSPHSVQKQSAPIQLTLFELLQVGQFIVFFLKLSSKIQNKTLSLYTE